MTANSYTKNYDIKKNYLNQKTNSSNTEERKETERKKTERREIILEIKRIDSVVIIAFVSFFSIGILAGSFIQPSSTKLSESQIEEIEIKTTKRVLSSLKTSLSTKLASKLATKQLSTSDSNQDTKQILHIVAKKRINLRAAPSLQAHILAVIEPGTALLLVSKQNSEWFEVKSPVGKICWVKKELVQIV